ncbi:hypothetical protein T05_14370 [Trichinella murrelli]|uniref:Uncharacterized protein n=1 Tax=Trichinella murrelli TaxID=144512 RepID=A0A0V0T3L5_9BILA|nr:hypothetical protein T05_14370 [Trichinella murrelli]
MVRGGPRLVDVENIAQLLENCASNERPWSLQKQSGAPKYAMYFTISTLATVSASMLVRGNAAVHLVK